MMTPSVTPMVLIYARVMHSSSPPARGLGPAVWFAAGYFLAWCLFSAVAALAQWMLEVLALLTPMMAAANTRFGGAVLMVAGIYQWLPLKQACLAHCRAPLAFMQRHGGFQPSAAGSLRLGLRHGSYCVGCCWALMAVLFVVGVMNLLWIAALMILVLLEKVIPNGQRLARLTGGIAIAAGIWLIAA
jgi:predicted metal-binding membrane protein